MKIRMLLFSYTVLFMSNIYAGERHDGVRSSYVSFNVSNIMGDYKVAAKLNYPTKSSNRAAVIVFHGSNGIDSRGTYHSRTLNDQGFTTLEVDLWGARGWRAGKYSRPKSVHETMPDAFAALSYLQNLPEIDDNRIGILGFSWGGVISMLSRSKKVLKQYNVRDGFAANVSFYPVCWIYSRIPDYTITETNLSPLLILTGDKDDYDEPNSCSQWSDGLSDKEKAKTNVVVYENAYHGFNGIEEKKTVIDSYSHQGKGGEVVIQNNKHAMGLSNKATVEFFVKYLVEFKDNR